MEKGFEEEWYGEERFDGWTVTQDGTTYLLEPEKSVTKNNDGTISVTTSKTITKDSANNDVISEVEEKTITLPGGTMLTGHWTEVSNVVTFFVNFKGTILDTEGDVSGRRSDTFTKAVAVGHVFYGKQKVGEDQTFGSSANAAITAAFRDKFDPDDTDTQLVVDYLRTATSVEVPGSEYTTDINLESPGANSNVIEANTLQLLKDTGRTIQVATGTGTNPIIDNELCDVNHYEMRWYVMKEQADTWHIDGVLVAKTAEIAVVKTFAGLPENKVNEILEYKVQNINDSEGKKIGEDITSFRINTKLGSDPPQDYLTFGAQTIAGQVAYLGATNTNSSTSPVNSFRWTFNAITHEKYAMEEEQYEVDGYDVSTILVHYYLDEEGKQHTVSANVTGTADLPPDTGQGETETFPVTGGYTTAVSFNNFYTKTGTGTLALNKLDSTFDDYDSRAKLHGAEFTLYEKVPSAKTDESTGVITWEETVAKDEDGNELRSISNDNGFAYFSNLKKGTYYLAETKAPTGYQQTDKVWKVEVSVQGNIDDSDGTSKENIVVKLFPGEKDDQGNVTFSENGEEVYSTKEGIKPYSVENDPKRDTMIITKTFSGLSSAEMNLLRENSKLTEDADKNNDDVISEEEQSNVDTSGYYLSVVGYKMDDEGNKTDTIEFEKNLTLTWSYESMDGFTFTWHIAGLDQNLVYVLTEHNCFSLNNVDVTLADGTESKLLANYEDLIVTGTVNVADQVGEYRNLAFTKDRVKNTAFTSGGKKMNKEAADVVEIKNTYTNTFSLKLRKVDSVTKEPLRGAEFKIYGTYEESTNPADQYTYQDSSGKEQTMYYIQTITSGEDGYATIEDLRLSKGTNNFAYVLNETSAPNGYEKAAPQVVTVTVDDNGSITATTGNYEDGVLNYNAPNTRQKGATLDLYTIKKWVGSAKGPIKLELYQVEHDVKNASLPDVADAIKVAEAELKGEKENDSASSKMYGYESEPWKVTWKNLPVFGDNYGELIQNTGSDEADKKYDETHYHYFVREISTVDGYVTSYVCHDHNQNEFSEAAATQKLKLNDGSEEFTAWLLSDSTQCYSVDITNSQYYELPETGGSGTLKFTIGGLFLTAGSLLYGYRLRRKRERRLKM